MCRFDSCSGHLKWFMAILIGIAIFFDADRQTAMMLKISCIIKIDPLYTCVLANEAVSQNIIMTVTSGTVPSVDIIADRNGVCAGENIMVTATAKNAGSNPRYQWLLNDAMLSDNAPVYTAAGFQTGIDCFAELFRATAPVALFPTHLTL